MIRHEPRERAFQPIGRDRLGEVGDAFDAVAQQADVAPYERGEDVDDRRLLDRIEPADRAEVDQPERAVREGEDVARVRIGVEEPDPEHLVDRGPQQLLGQRVAVEPGRVQLIDVRQGPAVELLLDEHAARAEFAVHARHPNAGARAEQHRHLFHRVGFVPEVELLAQAGRELIEHLTRSQTRAEDGAPLRDVRGERERGEVALHHFVDVRALHLHDDGLTGVQPRAVGLTDGRGREWFPVELGEDLLDLGAELGFEHRLHLLHRDGRDPVLQGAELARDLGGHEVDAGRGDLARA